MKPKIGFGYLEMLKLPLHDELKEKYQHHQSEKLVKAIEGRKDEYLAGRICAELAAENLGRELRELPMGGKREPLWPEGLVGSISHTKGIALALLDKVTSSASIGIDIECIIDESKFETIESKVATDKELGFLKLFSEKEKAYTVLFSAKEALYKLLYPFCQCFFGFEEARLVALDFETGEFALLVTSEKKELAPYKKKYIGKFYELDGMILSVLRIEA